MVKKGSKDEENEEIGHDFTSIGDMTEFLHPEDPDAELKFKQLDGERFPEKEELSSESTTEDFTEELLPEMPPELPEGLPELPVEDLVFEESPTFQSEINEEVAAEENFDSTLVEDISFGETPPKETPEEIEPEPEPELYREPENFNEVQTFAQNFSYGEVPSGGNPPFSILISNLKFQEDADDILALLREFKVINAENEKDFIRAIEFGVLLIPQINEYLAIILTHKFRRFDCDIEMGLADQIQPSRSGEQNPRGLTNKSHLHQNRSEEFVFEKNQVTATDIVVSTTATLVGYKIHKYHGVETAFRLLETDDLDRLHFIQNSLSETLEALDEDTHSAYSDFTENFHQLYTDLLNEIKAKAIQKYANALLGASYSLTPYLSTKTSAQTKYQLTCTATIASVSKEELTEEDEKV